MKAVQKLEQYVYYRDYKNGLRHFYIRRNANSTSLADYKVPVINNSDTPEHMNWRNQHLCGGWSLPDIRDKECITRVVEGTKPSGSTNYRDANDANEIVASCKQNGLNARMQKGPYFGYEADVCVKGNFGDHYDMDSIAGKYRQIVEGTIRARPAYREGLGWYLDEEYFEDVLNALETRDMWDYFKTCDWANPDSPKDLMATGLLLGYPIEATGSLIVNQ